MGGAGLDAGADQEAANAGGEAAHRTRVPTALAGRSVLALFPTGAGKSLCYQLPALLLDGLTLVVSPLLALMQDQVGALRARGLAAARLDSTMDRAEVDAVHRTMEDGSLRLLYVSPERLGNEGFLRRLARCRIALCRAIPAEPEKCSGNHG